MKIAAYVAGDKNILKPSLVALKSLKKYNEEIDIYLLTKEEKICYKEKELLEKEGIKILEFDIEYEFSSSQNWPKEVFWNYKGPVIFYKLGYDYSIKIDSDTLCLQRIDYEKILPKKEVFSAVETGYSVDTYLSEERDFLIEEFSLSLEKRKYIYPNVGVIIFNNKIYTEKKIWDRMYEYSERIIKKSKSKSLDIIFADQALFAILLSSSSDINWKKISSNYNHTLHDRKLCSNYIKSDHKVKIYHYTGPKPWKKISLFYLLYNPYLYIYREKYFDYLKEINIYDRYLNIKSYRVSEIEKIKTLLIQSLPFKLWLLIWLKINMKLGKI